MSKDEAKREVTLEFTVSGVRAAAKNAATLHDVQLDVPCVNPKELSIDDKIYGLKIVPVKDSVKSPSPSTLCSVGVIDINIDTLSGVVKPGMVTVNNNIDIPKELGHTNGIEEVYFESKEAARAVAMVFLEEEMLKSEENVSAAKEIRDFLTQQFEAERV